MEVLKNVLIVIFIINCLFLMVLILLQSGRSSGMNLFGGGSQTAFGSSSADVLTKTTGFMTAIFLVLGLTIAYLQTGSKGDTEQLQKEILQSSPSSSSDKQKALTKPKTSPGTQSGAQAEGKENKTPPASQKKEE